jgi:predicted MFS family arabinose efflux permease
VGSLFVAAALIASAAVLSLESYWALVPAYLMLSVGTGLIMGPASTDSMNAAAVDLRGQASGVVQTFRQLGATLGIAIMGTVVANVQSSKLDAFIDADPDVRPGAQGGGRALAV